MRRLRAAGAVILGKLNMHEGALGSTTDNPHFGRTTNPYREGHSPGGSSGGAGAAVAAGLCCAALGSDIFATRLLGRPAVCVSGPEAAHMFWQPGRFTRRGALPPATPTAPAK